MPRVDFVLDLDPNGDVPTAARLWLDTSRDDSFDRVEEEVILLTFDGKRWVAKKEFDGPTAGMLFLLRFIAPVGTRWQFHARAGETEIYSATEQTSEHVKVSLAGRLQ